MLQHVKSAQERYETTQKRMITSLTANDEITQRSHRRTRAPGRCWSHGDGCRKWIFAAPIGASILTQCGAAAPNAEGCCER
jgi:hypothetical protein